MPREGRLVGHACEEICWRTEGNRSEAARFRALVDLEMVELEAELEGMDTL